MVSPRSVKVADLGHLTLERDGVAFVRRAIDPAVVSKLRQTADFEYAMIENALVPEPVGATAMMSGPGGVSADASVDGLVKEIARTSGAWGGIPLDHYIAVSKAGPDVTEALQAAIKSATAVVRAQTGTANARIENAISYVRRHNNTKTYAPWHFDCYAAGTLPFDPCVNCWVPFVTVGEDCPSLEFMTGTHTTMRAGGGEQHHPGYPGDAWMAANLNGENYIAAIMEPGDVAIFDHYTLHRTQVANVTPGKIRTSSELRFTARP